MRARVWLSLTTVAVSLTTVLATSVDVRLVGGPTEYEGRVEVYFRSMDSWGTVCDTSWDDRDARVVCRQLGLSGGKARTAAFHGQGDGDILLDDVMCSGTEASIVECSHSGWGEHTCTHSNDAGVMCQPDIRLVGGHSGHEGRLEIYDIVTNTWGTVCSDEWNHNASEVVCRQLGKTGGTPLDRAMFDNAYGAILLGDVNCTGMEESLLECAHSGIGNPSCRHSQDVGVRCDPGIRLVGGKNSYSGRVEVYDMETDTWGTVCNESWSDSEAKVVCHYLGMDGGEAVTDAEYGAGTGPVHVTNVSCDGTEITLLHCLHNGVGDADCPHTQDAGVICDPPSTGEDGAICYVYRDGSVKTFTGKVIPHALRRGKNYIASLGGRRAPNDNNCKFATMAFYNKGEGRMSWGSFSMGVHGKNISKYYRNVAFERRGAVKQIEDRGYKKKQTTPRTFIDEFPYIIKNADNTLNVTVGRLGPKKGWQLSGGTCPYSVNYRFKKNHPAIAFKLRWGRYFRFHQIEGICTR